MSDPKTKLGKTINAYKSFGRPVIPNALAAAMFVSGVLLLINGILPVPKTLTAELELVLPLQVLEVSNLVMGAAGIMLIMVANAMRRRLKVAFYLALGLLLLGVVSLIAQRIDWDFALALLVLAGLLFTFRKEFYRESRLSNAIFSPHWFMLVISLLGALSALLYFAHEAAPFQNGEWWKFSFEGDHPRAMRVMGMAVFIVFIQILFLALRPGRAIDTSATPAQLLAVEPIVKANHNPDANFVFIGDKRILISKDEKAFIMYQRQGRSFVALCDPIGEPDSMRSLIDEFVDLADQNNCRPVFYRVGEDFLTQYLDTGFQLNKLGEEGVVDLTQFSLEGPSRSKLRQAFNRAGRDGLSFEVMAPPYTQDVLRTLKTISDEWLQSKNTKEKAFSLGRFDEAYMERFPIAVVKFEGEIVAFANIMVTDKVDESTIDLMRHSEKAPAPTMDFLFISLFLHLKEAGYKTHSLGMTPLFGLDRSRQKKLWDHVGMAIFKFGGHFYNFEGLRKYKEKFGPEWKPRYLVTWGRLDPLIAMADVNALVSGGLKGALTKT